MNTNKRFVFGLLSALLLAVGFVRAADQMDPMNRILKDSDKGACADGPAPTCTTPCMDKGN